MLRQYRAGPQGLYPRQLMKLVIGLLTAFSFQCASVQAKVFLFSGDDMLISKNTYLAMTLVLLSCLAGRGALAGVGELPVDADRCAILYALTGVVGEPCSTADFRSLGVKRSLPTQTQYPHAAASLRSIEEEQGYFVRFAFNSDALTPEYNAHLDRLATVLNSPALASSCLKLVGHTDSVGGPGYNVGLSDKRATQVATYLVARGAVHPDRIVTEARGETLPLDGLPGPHPRNRRVEILAKTRAGTGCR